jgi:hypothetical protein
MATTAFAALAILMIGGLLGFGIAAVCAMAKGNKADQIRDDQEQAAYLRDQRIAKLKQELERGRAH